MTRLVRNALTGLALTSVILVINKSEAKSAILLGNRFFESQIAPTASRPKGEGCILEYLREIEREPRFLPIDLRGFQNIVKDN